MRMESREILLKQQILRTQMEPHFIFNTLATLQSLIRSGASEQAIGYLTNLAKLMRFNFENAQENFVLLKSEVEALDSYLNLQTMYRPELFDYDIKVYEGFEDDEIFIPPMLLQPFLENAILHGFSKIDHKGHLNIKIEKRHFALLCIIEDNGRGLQPAHKNNKIRSTIINQERLQILEKQTGSPASLSIIDKSTYSQQGILVEIEIPFKTIKERKELLT